jgi:CHAT domain-containing protein/Tfp pilus assembly protein PilF
MVSLLLALTAVDFDADARSSSSEVFAAETLGLTPGGSLERQIHGGETLSFSLHLQAGTFLYLEIFQREMDLSPRLLRPSGEVMAAGADDGPQLLAAIADREETYRLELHAPQVAGLSKQFTIRVRELRPTVPGDESRVKGAKALTEARRLLSRDGEERRRQAETLLAESLAAWRTSGDARGEVEALFARAGLQGDRGQVKEALAGFEQALQRSREAGFAEGEARALSNMAYYNRQQLAQYDRAIELYQSALEIWRRVGGPYEQATALQKLALAYERKQAYEAELRTLQEALPLAETSGDLARQARALSSLGACYYFLGRPGARELWERALGLSRQGGDGETEAGVEQNLAVLYHNEGQFQRALDLYTRLVDRVPLKDSGIIRSNIGNLYSELGNPEKALESYRLAGEAYRAAGDVENEVIARVGIGRARQQMGDLQAALDEYEGARKALPRPPWNVFHSIGLVQTALGRPGEAVAALEQALAKAEETHDPSRRTATLLALGMAYAKLGQADRAAENLGSAIETGSGIGYQSAVSLAFLRRAFLRRDQGRLQDALADVEQAVQGVESSRRNVPGDRLRIGFSAAKRTYYDLAIDVLLQLDRSFPGKYRAQALEVSERARARGLLDLLAEGRIDVSEGLAPELRQKEETLSYNVSQVQLALRSGNSRPERIRTLQEELRQLDQQREQLDLEIRAKNRRYADVRDPIPLKLDQIQALLDDQTALLEYALGENRSTLFLVTRGGISVYELPAAGEINQRVQRLRPALERESLFTRQAYLDQAFQLYRDLLEPAAGALEDKPNLVIVPDGALYYVPFEALLVEPAEGRSYRDLPYLLRRHSIAYVPSASVLAGLREPRQESVPVDRKQLVAFAPFATAGNPIARRAVSSPPDANRWSFDPLPASLKEVSEIVGLYPGAAVSIVGRDANEASVAHNPTVAGARLLHFATHARIDELHPESSALVLAEQAGEDGFLQVHEIFNLKLSADLAVLSACQTALGKEVTGEGLVGLSRAFFYAGVPSLVVSLWNVIDGPTPDLMLAFYKELGRQQEKAKALQAAKLSMIDRGTYAHPSYWAPFVLLGEPH